MHPKIIAQHTDSIQEDITESIVMYLKEHFTVSSYTSGGEGNFKRVYPLTETGAPGDILNSKYALSVLKYPGSAEDMLKKESEYLNKIRELGLPAVKIYRSIEITINKRIHQGLIVEWVPNVGFIEAKTPKLTQKVLDVVLRGGRAPFVENPLPLNKEYERVKDMAVNKKRAELLLADIQKIQRSGCLITDLQILIKEDGHIVIIDPLYVREKEVETVSELSAQEKREIKSMSNWLMSIEKFLLKNV